jgi:hypothetical protein
MNYFCHGRRFLDRPYFLAGTAIPDWLNVTNRRVRVRAKHAKPLLESSRAEYRELAAGVVQHHHDDDWFHRTRAFAELSLLFAVDIRDGLPVDDGLRPSFLGHILVELLLDDCLIQEDPSQLDRYYEVMQSIDGQVVGNFIAQSTGNSPELFDRFVSFLPRFAEVRFLYDYADNAKLLFRLNNVMDRVGLAQIPESMLTLLPAMRAAVIERKDELVTPDQA